MTIFIHTHNSYQAKLTNWWDRNLSPAKKRILSFLTDVSFCAKNAKTKIYQNEHVMTDKQSDAEAELFLYLNKVGPF